MDFEELFDERKFPFSDFQEFTVGKRKFIWEIILYVCALGITEGGLARLCRLACQPTPVVLIHC